MKRLRGPGAILSPNPFPLADLGGPRRQGVEYGLYFRPGRAVGGAQPEQDSLQGKGARKDFVILWIIQVKARSFVAMAGNA